MFRYKEQTPFVPKAAEQIPLEAGLDRVLAASMLTLRFFCSGKDLRMKLLDIQALKLYLSWHMPVWIKEYMATR